jgi:hypothetical protein
MLKVVAIDDDDQYAIKAIQNINCMLVRSENL